VTQAGALGPSAQAAVSVSRFASEQTFWSCVMIGVVTPAGHEPYGAGHVVCLLLQRRGVTRPLQNEPDALQSAQAAPP